MQRLPSFWGEPTLFLGEPYLEGDFEGDLSWGRSLTTYGTFSLSFLGEWNWAEVADRFCLNFFPAVRCCRVTELCRLLSLIELVGEIAASVTTFVFLTDRFDFDFPSLWVNPFEERVVFWSPSGVFLDALHVFSGLRSIAFRAPCTIFRSEATFLFELIEESILVVASVVEKFIVRNLESRSWNRNQDGDILISLPTNDIERYDTMPLVWCCCGRYGGKLVGLPYLLLFLPWKTSLETLMWREIFWLCYSFWLCYCSLITRRWPVST